MAISLQAVVIGAGISGLSCAFRLHQLGVRVALLEQAERVGGVIGSFETNGFLFESGPQSFLATEPLLELVRASGLEDELLEADPRAPRFVLHHGRLRAVPMSAMPLLLSSLLRATSKMRILSEPLLRTQPPDMDESVADFVRRKFGAEILDYLVAPFISGVYAGDPEKLSLPSTFPTVAQWEREYGSVIRGATKSRPSRSKPRPVLCNLQHGLATLTEALAGKLSGAMRKGSKLESVKAGGRNGSPEFELRVSQGGEAEILRAPAVVLAVPAYAAARLLEPISAPLAASLTGITYAPVAVVAGGYRREQVGHPLRGFGFLVPRREKLRTLGTVWNSSLFPGRAPEGMVALTSFAGGATDPTILQLNDKAIIETVEREIAGVLQISEPPEERFLKRHPLALPQYNLGHAERVAAISEESSRLPGLFLIGNYLEGPSVGDCVERGFRTAQAVRDRLAQRF